MYKELCYANNQKSLFRKYAHLVTWFAQTKLGRAYLGIPQRFNDIGLLVPNGFHRVDGNAIQGRFYINPIYYNKLAPALFRIDTIRQWIKDFKEAQHLLAWELGLTGRRPALLPLFASGDFTPANNAGAGYVQKDSTASWAAAHDAATGDSVGVTSTERYLQAVYTATPKWYICRIFLPVDTSSIGAGATITATTLKVKQFGTHRGTGVDAVVVQSTQASPTALTTADFNQLGTVAGSNVVYIDDGANAWHTFTFNATGRGWVDPATYVKAGLRDDGNDRADSAPSGLNDSVIYMPASSGNEPYYTITYTPGGGAFLFNLV